ncbi:unnamed protein product [Rhodiola kirilowii]
MKLSLKIRDDPQHKTPLIKPRSQLQSSPYLSFPASSPETLPIYPSTSPPTFHHARL